MSADVSISMLASDTSDCRSYKPSVYSGNNDLNLSERLD